MPAPALPTEILLTIAQQLDRPSIFASLRVCRQWSIVLNPYIWTSIKKTDWHHPHFPIRKWTTSSDPTFNLCLQHLQSLEWENNESLIRTKTTLNPHRQIRSSRLAFFLSMTPNLTYLAIRMEFHGPDPRLFDAIRGLPRLKVLDLDLPVTWGRAGVPIETMFPLFAQLEELHLGGSWYHHNTDMSPILEKASWNIKKLTIDLLDISLLRNCPYLEHLRMLSYTRSTPSMRMAVSSTLTALLTKPTSLKGIMFYSSSKQSELGFSVYDSKMRRPHIPHKMLNDVASNQKKWFTTEEVVDVLWRS
ncbi:hypothetical protein BGZ95_001590 [Linnemannia exigua]|uniref:F-box domain-containing protein n=1 Tax=Linnemannia exigua TaxID=604196 RepID=A0AAD4H2M9_9FUNG|nr:hypothetical protein BGZ95_001590 [Linnemannia exigua]